MTVFAVKEILSPSQSNSSGRIVDAYIQMVARSLKHYDFYYKPLLHLKCLFDNHTLPGAGPHSGQLVPVVSVPA